MKLNLGVLFLAWNLALAARATEPQRTPPGRRSEEVMGAPDLYRRVSPSVVSIVVSGRDGKPQKTGSGVVIDTAGHVFTNYHVVEGGSFFDVRVAGQGGKFRSFVARPAACAPDQDLAEIELGSPAGLRSVKKASGEPEVGSRVYAVGSPLQLEGTLTEGVVSQVRDLDEQKLIQTTAAISPGSSGGGLFNSRAELVGITTLSLSGGQNLNFAVSLAGLRALTPCDEFPVVIGKLEPTQTPTPSAPPKWLPCSTPYAGLKLNVTSSEQSFISPEMTMTVSGWVTNTGCQKFRDFEVKIEVYRVGSDETADVFSGRPQDSELEVGGRSFIKITARFRGREGDYSFRPVMVRLNFVEPATGALIPFFDDVKAGKTGFPAR